MAETGYINQEVAKMYGIPYSQLTPEQKRILHDDSVRRAKLIKEREQDVLKNNRKAFEDEAKMEKVLGQIYRECQKEILADVAETIAKVQKAGGDWSYANQSALTRSRGLFEQIESTDIDWNPELSAEQKAVGKIIADIIDELPPLQKAALTAFYYDGLKIEQIALMYECSSNTIKSRLNYAKKLRK